MTAITLSAKHFGPLFGVLLGALCQLAAATPTGVAASMAKRGNIRYGPDMAAPVITTLTPGSPVQLLHKVGQEWYAIQFPRQGHAWMHDKVLVATDDPRLLRVIVDKAHVRADSRIKAELVAQLDLGDTVEWVGAEVDGRWQGRKIGDWYAVYPPSAVAYCHHSVLQLSAAQDTATRQHEEQQSAADGDWQAAKATYATYFAALQRDQAAGLGQDWQGLSDRLQRVIDEHPRMRTRLDADRLQRAIKRVLAVAGQVQSGRSGVALLPEVAPESEEAPAPPVVQAPPEPPVAQPPVAPPEPAVTSPPAPVDPPVAAAPVEEPLPSPAALREDPSGWLMERDLPGTDARHVLVDAAGAVTALVRPGPQLGGTFAEYFWRRVAVSGPSRPVTVTIDGERRELPLVEATGIAMVQ